MKPLHKATLAAIKRLTKKHKINPSLVEIAEEIGKAISSTNAILAELEEMGLTNVIRVNGRRLARGITLV